jgi:DNA-binding CsgD family transcriptional regulator
MSNFYNELPKITFQKFRLGVFLFTENEFIRTRVRQAVSILDTRINTTPCNKRASPQPKVEKKLYIVDPSIIRKKEHDIECLLNSDKFSVLLYGGPAGDLVHAQSVRYVAPNEVDSKELANIIADVVGIKNLNRAPKLSQREREILQYYGRGYTLKAIGYELGISPKSAETYKSRACRKLGLTGRAAVLNFIDPRLQKTSVIH